MNHETAGAIRLREALPSAPFSRAISVRAAASVLYLVDGMTFGIWAALIPSFQQKFSLSAERLSLVLVGLVVGSMSSMTLAGKLIAKYGSQRVGVVAGVLFPASLFALLLAPTLAWLGAAGVLFGACKGALDISVSAQGIAVENALGKPVVSSFNGFWSFGGLTAAAITSISLHQGLSASLLMSLMAGLLVTMTLAVAGSLLVDEPLSVPPDAHPRVSRPDRCLLSLGALAFLALFSEGVLMDWSAAYAHTVAHVSLATAPIAFAAFSVCMAVGRFAGDWFTSRWGEAAVLRCGALLMVLGTALAVAVPAWPAILAGFMVVGLGIANLVPTIFRAAGRVHAHGAGPGVALVSTLGYTGFLCGPPAVGFTAALAGLPTAFCLVIVLGLVVAFTGKTALAAATNQQGRG